MTTRIIALAALALVVRNRRILRRIEAQVADLHAQIPPKIHLYADEPSRKFDINDVADLIANHETSRRFAGWAS